MTALGDHVPHAGHDQNAECRPGDAIERSRGGAGHVGAEPAQHRHQPGEGQLAADPHSGGEDVQEQPHAVPRRADHRRAAARGIVSSVRAAPRSHRWDTRQRTVRNPCSSRSRSRTRVRRSRVVRSLWIALSGHTPKQLSQPKQCRTTGSDALRRARCRHPDRRRPRGSRRRVERRRAAAGRHAEHRE